MCRGFVFVLRAHVHHRQHRRGVRLVQNPVLDQLLVVPEEQGAFGDLEVVTGDAASDGVHEKLRNEGEKPGREQKDEGHEEEDTHERAALSIHARIRIRLPNTFRSHMHSPPNPCKTHTLAHLPLPPALPQFLPPSLFPLRSLPLTSPQSSNTSSLINSRISSNSFKKCTCFALHDQGQYLF